MRRAALWWRRDCRRLGGGPGRLPQSASLPSSGTAPRTIAFVLGLFRGLGVAGESYGLQVMSYFPHACVGFCNLPCFRWFKCKNRSKSSRWCSGRALVFQAGPGREYLLKKVLRCSFLSLSFLPFFTFFRVIFVFKSVFSCFRFFACSFMRFCFVLFIHYFLTASVCGHVGQIILMPN